ncbi:hypothetical protein GCM10010170_028400 [Dactylosporangium salmoneum]|uniref:Uncharacterized protein n=1 Tax=Dactylosporangium salmoneum TaxID=53361 RepID=A0ABP5T3X2_9ACTN
MPEAGTPDVGTAGAGIPGAGTPNVGTAGVGMPEAGTPDVGTAAVDGMPEAGSVASGSREPGWSGSGPTGDDGVVTRARYRSGGSSMIPISCDSW